MQEKKISKKPFREETEEEFEERVRRQRKRTGFSQMENFLTSSEGELFQIVREQTFRRKREQRANRLHSAFQIKQKTIKKAEKEYEKQIAKTTAYHEFIEVRKKAEKEYLSSKGTLKESMQYEMVITEAKRKFNVDPMILEIEQVLLQTIDEANEEYQKQCVLAEIDF